MKIVLGFEDVAYSSRFEDNAPLPIPRRRQIRKFVIHKEHRAYGANTTTGQVAEDLEKRYKIVAKFAEMEMTVINKSVATAMEKMVENAINGEDFTFTLPPGALKSIENKFRQNLTQEVYNGILPGVPTKAAQAGVSRQFRKPFANRPARPSFVDTGMYRAAFKAWLEP